MVSLIYLNTYVKILKKFQYMQFIGYLLCPFRKNKPFDWLLFEEGTVLWF